MDKNLLRTGILKVSKVTNVSFVIAVSYREIIGAN